MNLRTGIAAAAALALAPAVSFAVDGVILIDQNKALAGNVTPGDTPGFPVTITAPGSYRLAGNLTVPVGGDGIAIAADGVTVDLNGFSIIGSSSRYGIHGVTDHRRITVRNGHVTGFGLAVDLLLTTHGVVEDMTADSDSTAIVVGRFSRVSRNIVNGTGLIQAECPTILTENISDGFMSIIVPDPAKQCIFYHNRNLGFGARIAE